ncbi:hypothetical protein ACN47E_001088 [Coniothyrium glycines]
MNTAPRIADMDVPAILKQDSSSVELSVSEAAPLSVCKPQDYLRRFPTEIRLMIFTELLVVWPHQVFRGAFAFGPLDDKELQDEIQIPWQILATCRKYYAEAMPILYSQNRLVFCTGMGGDPGKFWRFPIKKHYMPHLTDLSIFFRADAPNKPAAQRIGHFIDSLARRAVNLAFLTVTLSSDLRHEQKCPWDIVFCDHPVAKALTRLVEAQTVQHLKLRVHDGAKVFPSFAQFLQHAFLKGGGAAAGRSITFTTSCTCAHLVPSGPSGAPACLYCACPWSLVHVKPVEIVVPPVLIEADQEHMMDMQHALFELGVLPLDDDDDDDGEEEAGDGDGRAVGPYDGGSPIEDDYEETRKAFDSGMLLPGQVRKYRGGALVAPKVWFYKQTKMKDFFEVVEKELGGVSLW